MPAQQLASERTAPRARAWPWVALSYLLVGLVALLPRVLGLGVFLSGDESQFWLRRSQVFLSALRAHDWLATAITTHPGVTTMWLGSAGLLLRGALPGWGLALDPSFTTFLTLMRLPTALVHTAAVLAGYALLRRMLGPAAAGLAALLWATDPFVIAFSRVLHVDALAGSFLTLSLLAACLYWHHDRRARWLVGSAVAAGLAILSKSPALGLLPWVGLVAVLAGWNQEPRIESQEPSGGSRFSVLGSRGQALAAQLRPTLVSLLAWGLVCAATVFVLWPALWVDIARAYAQVRLGIEAEGAQPHMLGNFFLGREDDAPGALFYPVALALRLTPWAMLGLLLLGAVWRHGRALERRDLAALAGFALLFIAAMTLFPKKFNRYLVPIFPALEILAACGLVWAQQWLSAWLGARPGQALRALGRGLPAGLAGVVLLAAANLAWWHPYEMLYFNQALGGARAGANAFTTGWGEGLSEAAAWLNQQPDITGVLTVSTMVNGLHEYMRPGAQALVVDGALPPKAGYVLVYLRNSQWGRLWPPFDQYYGREAPLHVVTLHGIDYAWIYQVAPPVEQPLAAGFGPDIRLRGLAPDAPARPGQTLTYRLFWKTIGAPPRDYTLFVHLIGADGQRYAQADLPYPTGSWGANRYVPGNLALPLPAGLPSGEYRLVIGLYDPQNGQRLPLQSAAAAAPALDGPDALVLTIVQVEP
ncbi:MAG: glycosyltransferase family 39 protein [Kouleothrix sp.]|jgi:4-amino-4-deoxy-L-arabinose transferase-like glycosyltransferase|nr:glycosyltransferase family 39 protein [Kouleothrix sp.]